MVRFKVKDSDGNNVAGVDLKINGVSLKTDAEGEVVTDEAFPCSTKLDYAATKEGFLAEEGTYFVPKTHEKEVMVDIVMKMVYISL